MVIISLSCLGYSAPPVICGYNTGQHMYVESSEQCNKIIFNIGLQLADTSSRAWMIRVTQFDSTQVWRKSDNK